MKLHSYFRARLSTYSYTAATVRWRGWRLNITIIADENMTPAAMKGSPTHMSPRSSPMRNVIAKRGPATRAPVLSSQLIKLQSIPVWLWLTVAVSRLRTATP